MAPENDGTNAPVYTTGGRRVQLTIAAAVSEKMQ
jgi:hypothetical protein